MHGLVHLRIYIGDISSILDLAPLIVIQPFLFTNRMPTKLNNMEWNAFKDVGTRGPKGGIEVR